MSAQTDLEARDCEFCGKHIAEPQMGQRFCKKACRDDARKAKFPPPPPPPVPRTGCPHPEKLAWKSAAKAQSAALRKSRVHGAFAAYRCRCGNWHITHKRAKSLIV